ncbi:sialin-like [Cimex lectularius]|uniref:Sialin n=1 Tax=Cimex lectularius TaxID=79782 RepID=A0A8I6SD97_CIMLE|nr:sialin-like [Cimex lectularius]
MTYKTWKDAFQKACIPQRYILGIMGFLGIANAYTMRACLSITITQMVKKPSMDNFVTDEMTCPWPDEVPISMNSPALATSGNYDWDETTQGLILSAFYYGYLITHIPGGLLAERFGGKHTMGFGILSTAIFSLLTPFVADYGAIPMITLRFLMGLGEGTTFPALSTLLAQWAPPLERSKLGSLVFAGVQIGTVLSISLSGVIIEYTSWPYVFYIFGVVGVAWFVVWCLLCYNDPGSHPFISENEKEYLKMTIGRTERNKDLGGTPWKAILTSAPIWALVIGEIGHDFGLLMMVSDLPKYMSDVMHFKIGENGGLSALPYLVMWLASLFLGYFADLILSKNWMDITLLRKTLATLGAIGPAVGCIMASYAGCNKPAVVTLFTVGMGFMGFCYSSLRVNGLDISPNYAGTIMAIVNGMGSISGMVGPILVGYLTPNRTLTEWRQVFWVMVAMLVGTNFIYVFYGTAKTAKWNDPKSNKNSEEDKANKMEIDKDMSSQNQQYPYEKC